MITLQPKPIPRNQDLSGIFLFVQGSKLFVEIEKERSACLALPFLRGDQPSRAEGAYFDRRPRRILSLVGAEKETPRIPRKVFSTLLWSTSM